MKTGRHPRPRRDLLRHGHDDEKRYQWCKCKMRTTLKRESPFKINASNEVPSGPPMKNDHGHRVGTRYWPKYKNATPLKRNMFGEVNLEAKRGTHRSHVRMYWL